MEEWAKWEIVHLAAWNGWHVCAFVLFCSFLEWTLTLCTNVTLINYSSFRESNATCMKLLRAVNAIDVVCVYSVWVYAIRCCAFVGILCRRSLRWGVVIFTNVLLALKDMFFFICRRLLAMRSSNFFLSFLFSSIIFKFQGIFLFLQIRLLRIQFPKGSRFRSWEVSSCDDCFSSVIIKGPSSSISLNCVST